MSPRVFLLVVLLAVLATAAPATAAFVELPAPSDLAALHVHDQDAWAAEVSPGGSRALQVTTNRGQTWTTASGLVVADERLAGVAAAPDGYRAVIASTTQDAFRVRKISTTGVVTDVGGLVEHPRPDAPFDVDDAGTTWVGWIDTSASPAVWGVTVVGADGTVTELAGPPPGDGHSTYRVPTTRTVDGMRAVHGGRTFRAEGGSLVPAEDSPVLFRDGALIVRESSTSYDGGSHWGSGGAFGVIRGAPGRPAGTHLVIGGRPAARFDGRLFRASSLTLPDTVGGAVVATAGGFVGTDGTKIFVHDGALPDWPAELGPLAADTVEMLARANALRADVGLPPLIGHPGISQAARNHAAYDAQWGQSHYETPGNAGFTGVYPWDRCAFVGVTCDSEVMHYWVSAADAVDGWIATPFHRGVPLDPTSGIVGAARSPGPQGTSVMDGADDLQALVKPFGYPQGSYRGPLGFLGESPDPASECATIGQPFSYPAGPAITISAPTPATMIGLREVGGGDLPGCRLREHFIPEEPLVAGRTYEATAAWEAGDGAQLPYSWTFTANPDPHNAVLAGTGGSVPGTVTTTTTTTTVTLPGLSPVTAAGIAGSCRPARPPTSVRRGRTLVLRATGCRAGNRVVVTLRRGAKKRVVKRWTVRVVRGRATVKLSRRLATGRYLLEVRGGRGSVNRTITVRR